VSSRIAPCMLMYFRMSRGTLYISSPMGWMDIKGWEISSLKDEIPHLIEHVSLTRMSQVIVPLLSVLFHALTWLYTLL